MSSDVETLALNVFTSIVMALPSLQIDPQRNVRHLLLTIARRGQIDEYRRDRPISAQRQASYPSSSAHQQELADPESSRLEEHTVHSIDNTALLDQVWRYWWLNLSATDYKIMHLRWRSEPPCPFSDIAARLGPGWEETTVRQRHHRIMNKTREYLRANGLIDENTSL